MTGGAAALKLEEGRAALRYRAFKLVRGKFARSPDAASIA
jgi:hypothetical protein